MIKSLRGRLILTYILSFFIIIALLGGVLYTQQRATLKSIIEDNSAAQSKLFAQRVSTMLHSHIDLLHSVAESDAGRSMNKKALFKRLQELLENDHLIVDNAGILYPNGDLYEMNNLTANVKDRAYFRHLFTYEMDYVISDPIIDRFTQTEIIVIGVPIRKQGNIIGAILIPINLYKISESLSDVQLTENSYGWIVHPSGLVLAHPNGDYVMTLNLVEADAFGYTGLANVIETMNNNIAGVQSYYDTNLQVHKMMSYSAIPNTPGWRLGITTPIEEVYEPLERQVATLTFFLILALLISILLAISFASTITRPLASLTEAVEDLGRGHLSTIPENNAIKEVSVLIKTFNHMSTELSDLSENLEKKVGQRTKSLKEMNLYLNDLATKDHLTNLYNRAYTIDVLNQLKSTADNQNDYNFGIFFIDLNNFKYYNDTFGHDKGDELLKLSASIITNRFRDSDVVTRYGGDEFIVILTDITRDNFYAVLNAFKHYAMDEINFDSRLSSIIDNSNIPADKQLNFAIGHCFYSPEDARTIDRLVQLADDRMYEHKAKIKNNTASPKG